MQNCGILVYENVHEDVCQILQNTGIGECVADIAECYYRKMCEGTFSVRKICELTDYQINENVR